MNETLHGFLIQQDKIVIFVTSTGCTVAGHFKFEVHAGTTGYMLTVVRTEEDPCRQKAEVIDVTLDLPEEVRNKPFTIQNWFASGAQTADVTAATAK